MLEFTMTAVSQRVMPLFRRLVWWTKVDDWKVDSNHSSGFSFEGDPTEDTEAAALLSSKLRDSDEHLPVIDIDLPCLLLDSKTPGHHHLIIDCPMSRDSLLKLLHVMVEVGIVESGYLAAAESNGFSLIRAPWNTE